MKHREFMVEMDRALAQCKRPDDAEIVIISHYPETIEGGMPLDFAPQAEDEEGRFDVSSDGDEELVYLTVGWTHGRPIDEQMVENIVEETILEIGQALDNVHVYEKPQSSTRRPSRRDRAIAALGEALDAMRKTSAARD